MQKYNFYKEKSFFIIFFVSVYISVLISLVISKASPNASVLVFYVIPQLIYISATIIYSKINKIDMLRAMPIKFKIPISKYLWVFVATVSIFSLSLLPNLFIISFFYKIGLHPTVNIPSLNTISSILLAILIICIMPALGEEIVFRGVCNSSFKEYGGIITIFTSGLMFSLSHFNLAQTIYQFFLGVFLSYLYLKTQNLLMPILIHFLNNVFALFVPLVIPFFKMLPFNGTTFAVLIPMFIVGSFVAVLSIRQLVDDTLKSKTVTVFEYNPTQNDFVAVATEQATEKNKENFLKKIGYQITQNFMAIISVFDNHQRKEKINRFKELYPKTKKVNIVIKSLIVAIIGLWLISVLL